MPVFSETALRGVTKYLCHSKAALHDLQKPTKQTRFYTVLMVWIFVTVIQING